MKKLVMTGGVLAVTLVPAAAFGGELPAQESLQGLQFNLSPPGARSLGMGGAFIGRADDATAAFANPAGLVNLFAAEISLEGRQNDYESPYTSGGTFPDMLSQDVAKSDTSGLSFGSFATPLGESLVLAVYGHQYVDFESAFETSSVLLPVSFIDAATGDPLDSVVVPTRPTVNGTSVDIANYGVAAGWRLSENFSLGIGVSFFDLSMNTVTNRLFTDGDAGPEGDIALSERSVGNDDDTGFNIGFLWRMTETLSLGAVYRSAPEFDVVHMTEFSQSPSLNWSRVYTLEAPDVYGVGLSWQPTDSFTLGFDVSRVNYSNLTSEMFSSFNPDPSMATQQGLQALGIDDGTEYRLGAEYVFLNMGNPLAIRAGVWQDPDHFIRSDIVYDESDLVFRADLTLPPEELQAQLDEFLNTVSASATQAAFLGGDDELHYSFGVGMSFSRFQIDAAADFSDFQNIYSLSAVFRFE